MPTFLPAFRPTRPLIIGDRAPAFDMVDPLGSALRSADLLRSSPVLLTFYRGAWCPCCQADLRDLRQAAPLLGSMNLAVLGVFHGLSGEGSARIRDTHGVEFALVDDPEGRAAQAFGIRRSAEELAQIDQELGPELIVLREGLPWIEPMQARFLVGSDGVILHAELVRDYGQRSNPMTWLPSVASLW